MTQVNLLPPELRQRQRTRRQTALVAVAGAVVLAGVLALWFLQGMRIADLDEQIDGQQAENARLQQQVNELQRFADLRADLEARRDVVSAALRGGVEWSSVMRDVSVVIPDRMWLTSVQASAAAAAVGEEEGAVAANLIGTITFQGESLDTDTLALWLTRLESVPGWVNPWLSSAQESQIDSTEVFTFSSSVDLTGRAARGGRL
jgi:Tfp pilus assembly protein PilN